MIDTISKTTVNITDRLTLEAYEDDEAPAVHVYLHNLAGAKCFICNVVKTLDQDFYSTWDCKRYVSIEAALQAVGSSAIALLLVLNKHIKPINSPAFITDELQLLQSQKSN